MLLPLIEIVLLVLLISVLVRFTLRRIDRASRDLEFLGHPFTVWNWMNLPGLRGQHRLQQLTSARDYLESVAGLDRAKQLVHGEILKLMENDGLTFESAARAVLLEETGPMKEDKK